MTLTEFKAHAKITQTYEDDYIEDVLLPAATEFCQNWQGRQYISCGFTDRFDYWPDACSSLELRWCPVSAVSQITYVDASGIDGNILTSTIYETDLVICPAEIFLAYGQSWPAIRSKRNAISAVYTAGYGVASTVPARAKQAINLLANHWIRNREGVLVGSVSKEIEFAIKSLLGQQRVLRAA